MITFLRTLPPVANSSQSIGPAVPTCRLVRAHKGTGSAHHGDTIDALPAGGRPQFLDNPLCRTGARDRDAESSARPTAIVSATEAGTLVRAIERHGLVCFSPAPGSASHVLNGSHERGCPRLAVVVSQHERARLCVGTKHDDRNADIRKADGARSKRAAAPRTHLTIGQSLQQRKGINPHGHG